MTKTRTDMLRARLASSLGFALFLTATALWALTPPARRMAAGFRGRAAVFFICFASDLASPSDALPGGPDPKHDRGAACALCAACGSGDAPLAWRPGPVDVAHVQTYSLFWTLADRAALTPRISLSYRSRAPPVTFA